MGRDRDGQAAGELPPQAADLTLAPLAGATVRAKVGGRVLRVKPCGLVDLAEIYQLLKPLLSRIETMASAEQIEQCLIDATQDPDTARALLESAAIGTGQPLDWINDLEGEQQLQLVRIVLEVNGDFFAQRLLPGLIRTMDAWMDRLLVGQTSSNSSSTTGTLRIQ